MVKAAASSAAVTWRPNRDASGELLVWKTNLPAVSLWLLVGDQWRAVDMGSQMILAIDLSVALDMVRLMKLPDPLAVIGDLKFIQACYLQEVAEMQPRGGV